MSPRSHSSVDPATPAGSRNMRARTQGGAQPSVAAADNFQVDAGVEAVPLVAHRLLLGVLILFLV